VNDTFLLDGVVTANGNDSNWIMAGARGGDRRADECSGGRRDVPGGWRFQRGCVYRRGAGGRIAVYYESSPGFEGFFASSAHGGSGGQAGEEGTIAFVRYWQNQQYLQVYQNLWFPEDSNLVYDGVVLDNQANLTLYGGSSLTVWGDLDV
jgi:hypothetical protein